MIYAFVLAEDGTRLMPTDIRHARRLLKKKEAVIAEHNPFTNEKDNVFQSIGIDAQTEKQATAYFTKYKPTACFIGICEGIEDKPGFPIITVPSKAGGLQR